MKRIVTITYLFLTPNNNFRSIVLPAKQLSTFFDSGIFNAVAALFIHSFTNSQIQIMTTPSAQMHHRVSEKASELGISSEIIACALNIICQNKNFINAIDHSVEIDDYIYRAILKQAFQKRMSRAEQDLYAADSRLQAEAEKELRILKREELTSDAFYRAVLPLMVKTLHNEPIRRLHAEEASTIVLELADCKRRFRSTSLTEIIVKRCSAEIEAFQAA